MKIMTNRKNFLNRRGKESDKGAGKGKNASQSTDNDDATAPLKHGQKFKQGTNQKVQSKDMT